MNPPSLFPLGERTPLDDLLSQSGGTPAPAFTAPGAYPSAPLKNSGNFEYLFDPEDGSPLSDPLLLIPCGHSKNRNPDKGWTIGSLKDKVCPVKDCMQPVEEAVENLQLKTMFQKMVATQTDSSKRELRQHVARPLSPPRSEEKKRQRSTGSNR